MSTSQEWVPKKYQFEAVKFMFEHANCGLLLDPGMGKTSSTLTAIDHFRKSGNINRVLIIAPIRPMYKVWPDEIKKWNHTKHLSYTILHGSDKDQKLKDVSDVYLLNPEGLKWFLAAGGMQKLSPDMLVVDESTKFKDYSTARFKLLKPHLKDFKRRVILTGEPVPNGYMDLFGQSYIVDQGNALGRFITHYRAQYFYQSGFGGYTYTLRTGADKEIQAKMKHTMMRLMVEDHLEMPDLIFNDIVVELDDNARKIYKAFEDDFLAEVGDDVIMSTNAAAVGSKCRQVANGGVYDENHIAHHIHDTKTVAIVDLVEQLQGNPLFVGYEFKHDLERLRRVFPQAPCLTGLTGSRLDQTIDAFNKGSIPVLLAHPASAGHGLNLQEACHHVCWYGLTWDYDLYKQFIARVWRQGQPSNRVFVHRIVADKTLDRTVTTRLLQKERTADAFSNAIKDLRNGQDAIRL
jgi:SNF2 family DNA or RNA helicase